MNFELHTALPVLSRTPPVLDALLRDLPSDWVSNAEGPETWSPFDVVPVITSPEAAARVLPA